MNGKNSALLALAPWGSILVLGFVTVSGGGGLLEAASILLILYVFFLRCADSALIVLAVRGSYSLRLADRACSLKSEEENEN